MKTLITGASSGLGAEMARQFAGMGHELALVARRVERLEELRDSLPGARLLVHRLDVDDHDAVFRVVRELDERIGGFDRVIVNAGLGKGAPWGRAGSPRTGRP
jgi:NADP-dependent 3-hydroxy acid dehydrogenase YdfG